jgi:hypothetical protein
MFSQFRKRGAILLSLTAIAVILACDISTSSSSPAFDPTKAALELQATSFSLQLTQVSMNSQASAPQPTQPATQPPVLQPTNPPSAATAIPPTPTSDVEAKIKGAKILVYENTDERGIGMWVKDALDGMGLTYTDVGSYSGHFMEYLNSGIKYDLIIVDAEDKDIISGEFWDVVNTRLTRDKAAMIAEIWYLGTESNGPIGNILGGCGIRYVRDMPLDDSIYWWTPTHPIFNEPNVVLPLIHYNRYWANDAGDKITLGSGGDATILAGLSASSSNDEGVLATCYQGRVIIETFSDHDYLQADIIALWQNYIHYTLKNHFAVSP